MTPIIFFLIYLPLITGGALLAVKRHEARAIVARFVLLLCLIASGIAVLRAPSASVIRLIADYSIVLGLGRFGRLIIVFVNLFGLLVAMYSRDSEALKDRKSYFPCLLWLVAYSNLVCLSMDFLVFIFGWGATLALLYALLNPASGSGANRALLVVGLGDFSLMLGIFIYVFITGSTIMPQETGAGVYLNNPLSWCAFILMLTGAFAKAGCAPMHTWIPVAAGEAPLEVMAILPASLDKLLGIYILARVCCGFFILNAWASALLLAMGSLTIVFAVLLALVQHDMRKLLSYHAISQVGYMVLGIGTGTAIGLVGGLFHMINHSIYKSGLFLSAGAVGQKEKTFDLEKLGGLASLMPLTFVSALVFSLSISGVPPFNGFVSKWLVYQGALEGASSTPSILLRLVYLVALAAAMLGSALTLASFVKFIHAVFLGQRQPLQRPAPGAVSVGMKASLLMLAALCVILGVLPAAFIRIFIRPWLNQDIVLLGSWNSVLAFLLLLTGVILGFIFWQADRGRKTRADGFFIGGEEPVFGPSFPATQFYRSLEELPLLKRIFVIIKLEGLDVYNILLGLSRILSYILFIFVDRVIDALTMLAGRSVFAANRLLRRLHTGNLDFYLAWSLLGLAAIFIILAVFKC